NNFGGTAPLTLLPVKLPPPSLPAIYGYTWPVSVDLKQVVQDWVNKPQTNYGIALSNGNFVDYASSEYGMVDRRPTRSVTYNTGPCSGATNGTSCSDGNACTQNDTCQGGVCVSGTPVVCPGTKQCDAKACDPTTGLCTVPDGTPCDDNDKCTQVD